MKPRHWFPLDLAALLFSPIIILAVSLLVGSLFPVLNWLRHLTGLAWLWTLGITSSAGVLGIV